jgi:hypothetical protein
LAPITGPPVVLLATLAPLGNPPYTVVQVLGTITRRKGGKVYAYLKYVCSTYNTRGTECGCGYHTVDQAGLLTFVLRKIRELVFAGGDRHRLRQLVGECIDEGRRSDPAEANELRAKVAERDAQLEQGTRRLLRAPDDLADLLAGELSKMRRDRDRLADQLAALDRAAGQQGNAAADADRATDRLWALSEELQDSIPPARMRELLRNLSGRIDLYFDRMQHGRRTECPVSRGTMHCLPVNDLYRLECRGDPIFTQPKIAISLADWAA